MSVSRLATTRKLGVELQARRKAAGLTLRGLEALVGMSNAKISPWENGHRLPSIADLTTVLDALNVVGDERERILAMPREAEGPGALVAGATTIGSQLSKLMWEQGAVDHGRGPAGRSWLVADGRLCAGDPAWVGCRDTSGAAHGAW